MRRHVAQGGFAKFFEKKFENLRRKFLAPPFDPVIAAQKRETIFKKTRSIKMTIRTNMKIAALSGLLAIGAVAATAQQSGQDRFQQLDADGNGEITGVGGVHIHAEGGRYYLRYTRRADFAEAGLTITEEFSGNADLLWEPGTNAASVIGTGSNGGIAIVALYLSPISLRRQNWLAALLCVLLCFCHPSLGVCLSVAWVTFSLLDKREAPSHFFSSFAVLALCFFGFFLFFLCF